MHERTYLGLRSRAEAAEQLSPSCRSGASVVEGLVLTLAWPLVRFAAIIAPDRNSRPLPAASRHPGRSKETDGLIGQLAQRPPEPRARKKKE